MSTQRRPITMTRATAEALRFILEAEDDGHEELQAFCASAIMPRRRDAVLQIQACDVVSMEYVAGKIDGALSWTSRHPEYWSLFAGHTSALRRIASELRQRSDEAYLMSAWLPCPRCGTGRILVSYRRDQDGVYRIVRTEQQDECALGVGERDTGSPHGLTEEDVDRMESGRQEDLHEAWREAAFGAAELDV